MCGFAIDTKTSTNSTVVYKTLMVTTVNETIQLPQGQQVIRTLSNAFAISVSFVRQVTIASLVVNVTMSGPIVSVSVGVGVGVGNIGNVVVDPLTGTITITLQTTTAYPYMLGSTVFAQFLSSLLANLPVGVTATIVPDPNAPALPCTDVAGTTCTQQWLIVISRGSPVNCDLEGTYTFNSTVDCRDAPCPSDLVAQFGFTLLPDNLCSQSGVDATAQNLYTLTAYADSAHEFPTSTFSVGNFAYFGVTVVDPLQTIDEVEITMVQLVPVGGSTTSTTGNDIVYSTNSALPAVQQISFTSSGPDTNVAPGTAAEMSFAFQFVQSQLPYSLGKLSTGSTLDVTVEVTLSLTYHGTSKKREVKLLMDYSEGSVQKVITLVKDSDLLNKLNDNAASSTFVGTFCLVMMIAAIVLI